VNVKHFREYKCKLSLFFPHTNQLNGFIRLGIQQTSHMDQIYETFMALLHLFDSYIYFFLCAFNERKASTFGMTRGWVKKM